MNAVYQVAGVSKQAVHQHLTRSAQEQELLEELIVQVDLIREEHPGCGVEKLYYSLQPGWLGRDRFIAIFMELGYRVRTLKNYTRTTVPVHCRYPNLIEGLQVSGPKRVWQSDITYIHVAGRFYYLVFIIDIYSRIIRGYQVSEHLRAEANIAALKMALASVKGSVKGLIHHSDRGSQYIDKGYLKLLEKNQVHVSMGKKAQDNAFAERINGIIKNEYLGYKNINSFKELKRETKKAVHHYNNKRIHGRLPGRMSPVLFEKEWLHLDTQNRPKVIVYADGNPNYRQASSLPVVNPETGPKDLVCPIVNK